MKSWISRMLGHEGQVAVALTAGFEYCCSGTIILGILLGLQPAGVRQGWSQVRAGGRHAL